MWASLAPFKTACKLFSCRMSPFLLSWERLRIFHWTDKEIKAEQTEMGVVATHPRLQAFLCRQIRFNHVYEEDRDPGSNTPWLTCVTGADWCCSTLLVTVALQATTTKPPSQKRPTRDTTDVLTNSATCSLRDLWSYAKTVFTVSLVKYIGINSIKVA